MTEPVRAGAAVSLLAALVACRRAPAPVDRPSAAARPPRSAAPAPPVPPPRPVRKPVPPPPSAVLFLTEGNGEEVRRALVPLACYDQARRAILTGPACAALVPKGAAVRLEDGATITLGQPTNTECEVRPRTRGFAVGRGTGPGAAGALAVWPPSAIERMTVLPVPDPKEPVLPEAELAALRSAAAAAAGKTLRVLEVRHRFDLDLDVDGQKEPIFSVEGNEDGDERTTFSALLLGGRPPAVLARAELPSQSIDLRLTVQAATDLDGDGQRELLLRATGTDVDLRTFWRPQAGKLVEVGRWVNCAPP